jgi:hypothetical protein
MTPKKFVCIVMGTILVFASMEAKAESGNSIAKVNSEPISIDEFNLFLAQNRAETFGYFHQKYGVDDSKGFWTRAKGGETPLERLKAVTLSQCVRIKVQQVLARQKGIVSDIRYERFLIDLEQENQRRKAAAQNHQPIYGPLQYARETYFNYRLSIMVNALKERMLADSPVPDSLLRSRYEITERREMPFEKSFDEVRPLLAKIAADERYEAAIDSLVKCANVYFNKRVYESLTAQ